MLCRGRDRHLQGGGGGGWGLLIGSSPHETVPPSPDAGMSQYLSPCHPHCWSWPLKTVPQTFLTWPVVANLGHTVTPRTLSRPVRPKYPVQRHTPRKTGGQQLLQQTPYSKIQTQLARKFPVYAGRLLGWPDQSQTRPGWKGASGAPMLHPDTTVLAAMGKTALISVWATARCPVEQLT